MAAQRDDFENSLATPASRAQRYAELRREQNTIDDEIREVEAKRWAALEAADDQRRGAALALIRGGAIEVDDYDARLRKARARKAVLADAIGILRERVEEDRAREAREEANRLRPAHREAVRRIARALIELAAANEAEAAIRRRVPGRANLVPALYPGIGAPHGGSPLACWLRFAVTNGLLTERDVAKFRAEAERG